LTPLARRSGVSTMIPSRGCTVVPVFVAARAVRSASTLAWNAIHSCS